MQGQQGAPDLAVGRGVDLATLGAAEEVIDHVKGALAVKAATGGSAVAKMLGALVVQGRLVEVEAVVCGRLRRIVGARVRGLVVLILSAHLASVVVIGWS